jgi:hypothetical protein
MKRSSQRILTTHVGSLPAPADLSSEAPDYEERLRGAVAELANSVKVVAEGAGALAYAALEQLPAGPPTVAVISGGNIAPRLLAELLFA